jgi:hypothetical protein
LRTTTLPFDLLDWCRRMSPDGKTPIRNIEAAEMLGVSESGYRAMERRCRERGEVQATVVKLAELLEWRKNLLKGQP